MRMSLIQYESELSDRSIEGFMAHVIYYDSDSE
jgi:hypothetical protein